MQKIEIAQLFNYTNRLTEIISILGVHLKYGGDFTEFRNCPMRQPERHPINPAFDPQYCDLNENNAFWMIGFNNNGEIVHTQAIKLLNLKTRPLQNYLDENFWDFRSVGYEFDKSRTQCSLSPCASRIKGRVTYHGELWMKSGDPRFRGGSLTVLLTRLFMMQAILRWNPDYLIGLQAPMITCRGLGIREGYMRAEQRTIAWYQEGFQEAMEDWMVWMSRDEALFNLRATPDTIYNMFKKETEPELNDLPMQLSA